MKLKLLALSLSLFAAAGPALAAAIDQQSDNLAAMSARVRMLLDRLAT